MEQMSWPYGMSRSSDLVLLTIAMESRGVSVVGNSDHFPKENAAATGPCCISILLWDFW